MTQPARNIYLDMKTLQEARSLWTTATHGRRAAQEEIPTTLALQRVTARPVVALRSVPHYHGAAMDGIAVKATETFTASDLNPLRLSLGVNAFAVDTGDPLPPASDAVIMIEQVETISDALVEIRTPAFPWQHVRKVGEDVVSGELLIAQQQELRPADLGVLLAAGVLQVAVFARPIVWIQPTGTELLSAAEITELPPGRIVEFNGTVLSGLVLQCGGDPLLKKTIPDDYHSIRTAVQRAAESAADIVLINAGSSAGSEDYTKAAIEDLGEVLVHGVTMMPGKPTVLGLIGGKPVVGIPGYPVSAIMAFEQFVRPLLYDLQGLPCPSYPHVDAWLARKTPSRVGLEEFVRVILGRVQGKLIAMPLQRGAGVITSLTRADGILQIPRETEGIELGEPVPVRLLRPAEQLDHTLIMIGSHDNSIDLLANELKSRDNRLHLSSSNVGSMGGLMAIRRGQTHLAGSHLLDMESGDYNFSYITRYLPGAAVRLVQLARRAQGLLVRPGNPKNIQGLADLLRPDVVFINRQGGSGTRILTDYQLQQSGIDPHGIQGYDQEEFTHMAVAVNVLSGRADAGMAIYAAARALGLEFILVTEERYDLVIPEACWADDKVQMVLQIIASEPFRQQVQDLGGYDVRACGRLMGSWDGSSWH
jgi:molybdenum cofactor synthesis domain-containing protein